MAIVKKPGEEEEAMDALGTGGGAGGGDVGGETASGGGAPRSTANGGTGFTNISEYLKENEGGGRKVGEGLERGFEKDISGIQEQGNTALQRSIGEIGQRGTNEYLRGDTSTLTEQGAYSNANPYQFNRGDVDTSGLTNQLNRLGSTGEVADLLKERSGGRAGISALDAALYSGETGEYRPEEIRNRATGKLEDYLKGAESQIGSANSTRAANTAAYNSPEEIERRRKLGLESGAAQNERTNARDWFNGGRNKEADQIAKFAVKDIGGVDSSGRMLSNMSYSEIMNSNRVPATTKKAIEDALNIKENPYRKWRGK